MLVKINGRKKTKDRITRGWWCGHSYILATSRARLTPVHQYKNFLGAIRRERERCSCFLIHIEDVLQRTVASVRLYSVGMNVLMTSGGEGVVVGSRHNHDDWWPTCIFPQSMKLAGCQPAGRSQAAGPSCCGSHVHICFFYYFILIIYVCLMYVYMFVRVCVCAPARPQSSNMFVSFNFVLDPRRPLWQGNYWHNQRETLSLFLRMTVVVNWFQKQQLFSLERLRSLPDVTRSLHSIFTVRSSLFMFVHHLCSSVLTHT